MARTLLRVLASLLLLPSLSLAEPMGLIAVPREHAPALRAAELMVEGGSQDTLHAHATAAQRSALSAAGVPFTVLAADLQSLRPGGGARGGYHTPESMSAELRALAQSAPELVRVVDLGRSWEGRELTGIVLTDQPDRREPDEPSYRILGTHHGDEWSSMEVAYGAAVALVQAYGSEPGPTALLDGSEVWVLPIVNPDGVAAFTRRNSRNVDLNRNYAYQWQAQSSAGSAPFSEVESDAVRVFSLQRSFGHSLSMHAGATNLGWVWNYSYDDTPDAAVMEALSERYLQTAALPGFWITNGADWYPTNGDTNDWSYGVRGGQDYTLELTDDKAPPADEIEDWIAVHVPPSIGFLVDGANTGARGRVTDPQGRGLEATLTSDLSPWPILADPETGAWAKPLAPGTHTLTVTAPGFAPGELVLSVGAVGDGATLGEVVLDPVLTLSVSEASGLEAPAGGGEARLCGAVTAHRVAGGSFALFRPGLGTWAVSSSFDDGCVALALDPNLVGEAWNRVGEWTLLALDDAGEAVAQWPLAVLFPSPSASSVPQEVVAWEDGGDWVIELRGESLPAGGELRFVGPDGVRRAPMQRLPDLIGAGDEVTTLSVRVDSSAWPEGSYSLRLLGRGELLGLPDALRWQGGTLSGTFLPPGDDDDTSEDDDDSADDDDDGADDDDDDDDDNSTPSPPSRACGGCAGGTGSGTLPLLALCLPLLRRKRTLT